MKGSSKVSGDHHTYTLLNLNMSLQVNGRSVVILGRKVYVYVGSRKIVLAD